VVSNLAALAGALGHHRPVHAWVRTVRQNLRSGDGKSAEGIPFPAPRGWLMRLAERCCVMTPTPYRATTDQLGRTDFDGASDGVMARLCVRHRLVEVADAGQPR
jgi:hypothetical protein